ncbi:PP2C family serine/threonine-protein phosphatase [Virgibacillus soli]|uniref:PP2C family serine/threonine-protein phosphatase n=1 Tax=Paracerasibacillus soli TaxID=480284 RepID=A0ABU5CS90_9BACI|nr:PP2C family serine/threonine-protein phosphatase [Virgibacillus soli]MDY0408702.1 PP2C family serine/threonine-protein phosphatase [Virgibacillus soli]
MTFISAYFTDIGTKKETNQDALLIKTAKTSKGNVGLFVVCDGMGGLTNGEIASTTVIQGLSDWFEKELPDIVLNVNVTDKIIGKHLDEKIRFLNKKIIKYGKKNGITLGTTLSIFLVIDKKYYIVQIGDSRIYEVGTELLQLTKDQTLVAREVERGNLTPEQAKFHPRRNVLLQCVGAREEIEVVMTTGNINETHTYLLCTDGFYHKIDDEELIDFIHNVQDESPMKKNIAELINIAKDRGETDNISAILVRCSR